MAHQNSAGSASGVTEARGFQLSGGAVASLTGVGLLLIFIIQNKQLVTLRFLFWSLFHWGVGRCVIVRTFGAAIPPRHRVL